MKAWIIFIIAFLKVGSLWAQSPDSARDLFKDPQHLKQWKRLLHYQKRSWGPEKSLLDGKDFFFAKDGHQNPVSELQASVQAFRDSARRVGPFQLPTACAFPARYRFVRDILKVNLPDVDCPKLREVMSTFKDPQSVSVVFSSAYPNNPASMFGHSFLKINSKKRSDLRDIGINYAAKVAADENPFAFIYFGITGGYQGSWSTENYYEKVRDYVQAENRDLWEYELTLSPQETEFFILHLWEIETNSYFDYYFFDENCSFQILRALEAVRPDWDITAHTIYVIPGESIKNLFSKPGIVKEVSFRPSLQRQVQQKREALSKAENQHFQNMIQGKSEPQASALSLETALSYFEFMTVKKRGRLKPWEKEQQLKLLAQRASLGPQPEIENRLKPIQAETRPDLGHDSYSLHLSQTWRERQDVYGSGGTTNLKLKSAYHDLMNKDLGFKKYSHIDFPSVEIQYDHDLQKLRINEINALSITSLPPVSLLSRAPSWKWENGLYTARDYGCLDCRHVYSEVGIGYSASLLSSEHLIYALGTLRGELYRGLSRGYRYGPGIEVGTLLRTSENGKARLMFKQFWDEEQTQRSSILQTYQLQYSHSLARNYELRTTYQLLYPLYAHQLRNSQWTLEFIYFFH